MTDSVSLILLETLQTKISQIPGVQNCYLDREEPVGDNEAKPVVVINSVGSEYTREASHTIRKEDSTIQIVIHVDISTTVTLSRRYDPWFSLIDATVHDEAMKVPGFVGVDLVTSTMRGEQGWLGFLVLVYNVSQIHQQGNRSAVPGIP